MSDEMKKGWIGKERFEKQKEMVELIYNKYFADHPNMTLDEIKREMAGYGFYINDAKDRTFLKSEASYLTLSDNVKRCYCAQPIIVEGQKYYFKTETGGDTTEQHKRFAKEHGIEILFDNAPSFTPVGDDDVNKLKSHNDELLSFFVAETKAVMTGTQYKMLSDIDVQIDRNAGTHLEVVGRYDLRDIIREIKEILERDCAWFPFDGLLRALIELLDELLNVECQIDGMTEGMHFIRPNGVFYLSKDYRQTVADIEARIRGLIEELKSALSRGDLREEAKKILTELLNGICPKIFVRKRVHVILGTFNPSKLLITLYAETIRAWLPEVDFDKKMLNVYTHELFHAFHYFHMQSIKNWGYDDSSRIVKESLARFIEYKYGVLFLNETDITAEMVRMWNDYTMEAFPYAGAKYINKFDGLCELVFKKSVESDTSSAYRLIDYAEKM